MPEPHWLDTPERTRWLYVYQPTGPSAFSPIRTLGIVMRLFTPYNDYLGEIYTVDGARDEVGRYASVDEAKRAVEAMVSMVFFARGTYLL